MAQFFNLCKVIILLTIMFVPPVDANQQNWDSNNNVMSPEQLVEYALFLEQNGDFARAATEYGRYLFFSKQYPDRKYPEHEQVMYRYALSLQQAGEDERALRAYSDFGATYQDSTLISDALYQTGEIFQKSGDNLKARSRFAGVSRYAPDSELAGFADLKLAWMDIESKNTQGAAQHLQKIEQGEAAQRAQLILESLPGLGELPEKDPLTAGVMSALLPGAGHAYVGREKDALFAFLSNGLMIGATVESFDNDIPSLGIVLGMIELGWYTGTIHSSVNLAHKYNREQRERYLDSVRFLIEPGRFGIEKRF